MCLMMYFNNSYDMLSGIYLPNKTKDLDLFNCCFCLRNLPTVVVVDLTNLETM